MCKTEEGSCLNRCFLLGRETKYFSASLQSCGVFRVFSIEYPVVFLECFQLCPVVFLVFSIVCPVVFLVFSIVCPVVFLVFSIVFPVVFLGCF